MSLTETTSTVGATVATVPILCSSIPLSQRSAALLLPIVHIQLYQHQRLIPFLLAGLRPQPMFLVKMASLVVRIILRRTKDIPPARLITAFAEGAQMFHKHWLLYSLTQMSLRPKQTVPIPYSQHQATLPSRPMLLRRLLLPLLLGQHTPWIHIPPTPFHAAPHGHMKITESPPVTLSQQS